MYKYVHVLTEVTNDGKYERCKNNVQMLDTGTYRYQLVVEMSSYIRRLPDILNTVACGQADSPQSSGLASWQGHPLYSHTLSVGLLPAIQVLSHCRVSDGRVYEVSSVQFLEEHVREPVESSDAGNPLFP
jgi:hypothetical protein